MSFFLEKEGGAEESNGERDAVLNCVSYDGARACAYASTLHFNGRARWACCADSVITQSCVVGSGAWALGRSWDVKARTKEEAPDAVVCAGVVEENAGHAVR